MHQKMLEILIRQYIQIISNTGEKMKSKQAGFTLIEIAIVLVIIGLLLGGVLKGQELINSAKVKNLATDFKNIPVYIYGYQDKFRALPGDDAAAASHVTGATVATLPTTCNNSLQGAGPGNSCVGNGLLDGKWNSVNTAEEVQLFWQHVRLAGLAPGPTAGVSDFRPTNASGGFIGIQSGSSSATYSPILDVNSNPIRGTYIVCSDGILGKFAKQLDIQMDDGATDTGSMMATNLGYGGKAVPFGGTTGIDDAGTYTVCMGI
jgi:prepilin-type N-terminal cleavage/methylation domain-containing protein